MLAQLLSPLPIWLLAAVTAATAVALIRPDLRVVSALACAAFLLGGGRSLIASSPELPAGIEGQNVLLAGSIDDDPVDRKGARRLVIRAQQINTVSGRQETNFRVEATVYGLTPVHYGDLVLLSGELQKPPRFEQFDYRAYLAEQGIAAVMPSARIIRVAAHAGDPFHTLLFAVRHRLLDAVDQSLPEPQAALLLGVVFGYRASLPPLLNQQMIASGLIHIVVISGLKVSLLARIVHQGLGRFLPRAAPLIAVGAMAGYALLAGASAAALRASAMGMLVVLAARLERESQVYVSLALTAALMLGIKPALAHDVSFQLSFAGTLGIASMTDRVATGLKWLPPIVRDPFAATVAAEVATWPLMLANFHQLSLIGPAANALVLPLLPAIMVVGGAGAFIGIVSTSIAWPAMQLAGMMASWFRIVIEALGRLPLAALATPYFPPRWLAAAMVLNGGVLAGIRLRQFFWGRKVWAALFGVTVIVIALLMIRPDGRVHIYALDVGTGSAILIRTANGQQILIDEGPDPDRFAQAVGRALPPTARTIDLWLMTGGRRQNIGAGAAALNRFHVEQIVVADPDPWSASLRALVQQAQAQGIAIRSSSAPLSVDGVDLRLAADGRSWLIGASSRRLAIIVADTNFLTLGADTDGAIFTAGGPADWQGPAHGFSVIQVAANSRDGLPARAVLQALHDAPLYRTDRIGTVELVEHDGHFELASSE